jgi:predicted DNA binding CopG/RHH family protein
MEVEMDRNSKQPEPKTAVEKSFYDVELDEEEQQIQRDLEAGIYVSTGDMEKIREQMKIAAKNTFRKKPVTIRMTNLMIGQLKDKATKEGMPYQTLMNSVLHKYLSGKLVERD